MDAGWLKAGPALGELCPRIVDRRQGRRRIALVIPTIGKPCLREHLERLAGQTSGDFDVIIVYGEGEGPAVAPPGVPCVHLLCEKNLGSAGGFYAGERFALDEGYEKVVLADDDCLPVSDDLIERLDNATGGADIALPDISYGAVSRPVPGSLLPHYGCVRASAFRAAGLTYAPFFFGGEDVELMGRLLGAGLRLAHADAVASHPLLPSSFLAPPQKTFYYIRGGVLGKYLCGSFVMAFASNMAFLAGSAYLFFIDRRRARALFDAATFAAGMAFFRREVCPPSEPAEAAPGKAVEMRKRVVWVPETRTGLFWYARILASRLAAVAAAFPDAARAWGKDAVFEDGAGIGAMPALLASRRAFIRSGGRTYIICDNKRYRLSPVIAAFLISMLPIFAAAAFCLTCSGFIMKAWVGADSRRYGVRGSPRPQG